MDDPCNGCRRHPDDCDCDLYRELSRIGDRFVADWALDTGPIEAPPAETRRYRGRLQMVAESSLGLPPLRVLTLREIVAVRMDGSDPGDEDPGPGLAATLRALFQGVQGSAFATWVSPGDEGNP